MPTATRGVTIKDAIANLDATAKKMLQSYIDIIVASGESEELLDYILILRFIANYCNNIFKKNPGKATEKEYQFILTLYGGMIRDIIAGKTSYNDMDLFITATNGVVFSYTLWSRIIDGIANYLTVKLPGHFTVIRERQKREVNLPCINSDYGHFKLCVKKTYGNGSEKMYNFDITANVSSDTNANILFNDIAGFAYCDYTVNNLMALVGKDNLFSDLMLRCPTIPYHWSDKTSTVEEVIADIINGEAHAYNIKERVERIINNISQRRPNTNIDEVRQHYSKTVKGRKTNLIANGFKICLIRL